MTRPSRWKRVLAAVDARLVLHNFLYEVPAYANPLPYLLGAITLAGLVILVVTGVLLGQFYAPDPPSSLHDRAPPPCHAARHGEDAR